MLILLKPVRKDNKTPVIIRFSNGKEFKKLMTNEKLQEFLNDNQTATVRRV